MRGSIRKRGSTYTYWLDIGPDPVTGKRRQRTKGGFRTKRECQAALNEAISALRSGSLVQPSRRTVASFLVGEWLPAVRMAGLRDSTWASYRMNVEKHLAPGLGAIELQRLSPAQLNAFYRELLTKGRRNALGGLAPKTVRYIHSILHRALRDAVRWGYVVRNVADAADPPKAKTPEMRVWNPAQLRAFLEHVRDDRDAPGRDSRVALERPGPGRRPGGGAAAPNSGGLPGAGVGAEDGQGSPLACPGPGDGGGAACPPRSPGRGEAGGWWPLSRLGAGVHPSGWDRCASGAVLRLVP